MRNKSMTPMDAYSKGLANRIQTLQNVMDKRELHSFIGKDGMPDVKRMNEDEDISVQSVCIVAMYCILTEEYALLALADATTTIKDLIKVLEKEL